MHYRLTQAEQHEDEDEQAVEDDDPIGDLPRAGLAGELCEATMALMPMPLARAMGKLATRPISTQQIAAAAAVQATAESRGTPAADRICGLTNRMYAIVRNVANAPRTSPHDGASPGGDGEVTVERGPHWRPRQHKPPGRRGNVRSRLQPCVAPRDAPART